MVERLSATDPAVQRALWKKPQKYHATRTEVAGIVFDSAREATRYRELLLLESVGKISGLEVQPRYAIEIRHTKVCTYVADFSYWDRDTQARIVEDVKSPPTRTPVYRLKRKLVKALYGLDVVEV